MGFSSGYICGVLCGSGHVESNKDAGKYYISLQTRDGPFLECFSSHMKKSLGEPQIKKDNDTYMLVFYGKSNIEKFISKWGLNVGKKNWSVPHAVFKDNEFRSGFLMGFFDSSGKIHVRLKQSEDKTKKRRSIRVYSINQKGLKDIQALIKEDGIGSMLYRVGACYCLDIEGWTRLNLFKNKIGFCSYMKKHDLENALKPIRCVEVKYMNEYGMNST